MLKIRNLSKSYWYNHKEFRVIDNINLSVEDQQIVVFLGPSGCGKTTLLKMISGLEKPSKGHIYLDGHEIKKPGQHLGVVFQDSSLFPWLTVRQNILFGPKIAKISSREQENILQHYLTLTQLYEFADFYPNNLSGGMKQRVSIARTMANNPSILLMDEPFVSLDSQIREQMQNLVTSIYQNERKTIIFITHDITEAILLADVVYVMTSMPMQIRQRIPIDLERPRNNLRYTNEFFRLEQLLKNELGSVDILPV